jgi:4-amino-4-deoxy-L-arabinose transferase-like glycosyltransferase
VALAGLSGLGPARFVVAVVLLAVGAWRVTGALVRPARLIDAVLVAWTIAIAWLAVVAEALSAFRLLGEPYGWLVGAGVLAAVGAWLPGYRAPRWREDLLEARLAFGRLHWAGQVIVVAVGVQILVVLFFTAFAGINVYDSISTYLPRSVRYLQNGTFNVYGTQFDYFPYLHQVVVAFQLVFLRSDVLVNLTSTAVVGLASLTAFAFARSLGWHGWLPLVAVLVPWAMPEVLLHASTSNFDTFEALWLVLALYFLRRGYASTSGRWLVPAALATGLALATKPTFWFAVPALGVFWLLVAARPLLRHRYRRALPVLLACVVAGAVVGLPYMVRNVVTQGFLLAPPDTQAQHGGTGSIRERAHLLAFGSLALGFQLLTPPSLLPVKTADGLDATFAGLAQRLGFRLPDPAVTDQATWPGLIRHASHRYDSNHASFGAAFVLVVLPAVVVYPLLRRRLGPRWMFGLWAIGLGLVYFVCVSAFLRYTVNANRYLIEMVLVLACVAPALFAVLGRWAAVAAVVLAVPLLVEMNDVIRNDKQVPIEQVLWTPRMEQFAVFHRGSPTLPRAARAFDEKYPVTDYPEVFVQDTGAPNFYDYTFLGPSLARRITYWRPSESPRLPGLVLTSDTALVDRYRQSGEAIADWVGSDVWLLLPNDRLRVRWTLLRPSVEGGAVLRVVASVPPGRYSAPNFGFSLNTVEGSRSLRRFSPEPTIDIPLDVAALGTVRIEVRDGENGRTAEQVRIERPKFMGL